MIYVLIAVLFISTTVKAGCGIANIDCPSGTSCKSGICQPDISDLLSCNTDTDCVPPLMCSEGTCTIGMNYNVIYFYAILRTNR